MRQCKLRKGNAYQVAWIDVEKGDLHRYVDLKGEKGLDKDWQIMSVSNVSFSRDWISKRGRDHKNMRKMTDI